MCPSAPTVRRRLHRLASELTVAARGPAVLSTRATLCPVPAVAAAAATDGAPALRNVELELFERQGYIICEDLVPPEHNAAIMQDMDDLMAELAESRPGGFRTDAGTNLAMSGEIARTETLGALPAFPPVVERVRCLMQAHTSKGGTSLFSLHHQHGARMDPGVGPREWHHDFEQYPQTDRDLLMVHCFYYPNGLNGEVGDLILLPGSHRAVLHRHALGPLFGTEVCAARAVHTIHSILSCRHIQSRSNAFVPNEWRVHCITAGRSCPVRSRLIASRRLRS